MTTTPPLHCSKPMRLSEMKAGRPWWCSECGEYIPHGLEGYTDKMPGPINVTTSVKLPPAPRGSFTISTVDGALSIDGSKITASEIRSLGRSSTGTFKTADGRTFDGFKSDAGAEWELREDTGVTAKAIRKRTVALSAPFLMPPPRVPFPSLDLGLGSNYGEPLLPDLSHVTIAAPLCGVDYKLRDQTPGVAVLFHHRLTDEELDGLGVIVPPHVRLIRARISREDFDAL